MRDIVERPRRARVEVIVWWSSEPDERVWGARQEIAELIDRVTPIERSRERAITRCPVRVRVRLIDDQPLNLSLREVIKREDALPSQVV